MTNEGFYREQAEYWREIAEDQRKELEKKRADLFNAMEVVCGLIVAYDWESNPSPSMKLTLEKAVALVKPKKQVP